MLAFPPRSQIVKLSLPFLYLRTSLVIILPFRPTVGLYVIIEPDSYFVLGDLSSSKCLIELKSAFIDEYYTVFPD